MTMLQAMWRDKWLQLKDNVRNAAQCQVNAGNLDITDVNDFLTDNDIDPLGHEVRVRATLEVEFTAQVTGSEDAAEQHLVEPGVWVIQGHFDPEVVTDPSDIDIIDVATVDVEAA